MKFVDRQIVQLASADTRDAFLDSDAIERLAGAAFQFEPGMLAGPWRAVFDQFKIAESLADRQNARFEARWDKADGRVEGWLDLDGRPAPAGIDAVWHGAVIGRGRIGGGRVAEVSGGFPGLEGIEAALAQPEGPARDAARRTAIAERLGEAAGRDDAFDDGDVATLLADRGGDDMAAYLETGQSSERPGAFRVEYADDAPAAVSPVRLELSTVIFVRDTDEPGFSLLELLRETRNAQALAAGEAPPRAEIMSVPRRIAVAALWIVPKSLFTDNGWPGGSPATRLAKASAWLAPYGIAVVTKA